MLRLAIFVNCAIGGLISERLPAGRGSAGVVMFTRYREALACPRWSSSRQVMPWPNESGAHGKRIGEGGSVGSRGGLRTCNALVWVPGMCVHALIWRSR
jgi:hypothetical protein